MNINIEKVVVHILDNEVGTPVLSELEHKLDAEIQEYLKMHIIKLLKDISSKKVYFTNEDNQIKQDCIKLKESKENFVDISKDIASTLYKIMYKNPDIPAGDLICVLFRKDDIEYLGILKLNYKPSYIHFIQEYENGRENKIIKQKSGLPSSIQKIDESIIIDINDFSILLKEKKYEIDGIKQFYLSEILLNSTQELSDKEKIKIIEKTSKKMVKDFYDGDIKMMAEIKNIMNENIEETGTISIDEISNKVFNENVEVKKIYSEEIEQKGLKEKTIKVDENLEKAIKKKQKLVTDNGIEIKLPTSYLTRDDKVEFISNADGTISIVLKGINAIEDK